MPDAKMRPQTKATARAAPNPKRELFMMRCPVELMGYCLDPLIEKKDSLEGTGNTLHSLFPVPCYLFPVSCPSFLVVHYLVVRLDYVFLLLGGRLRRRAAGGRLIGGLVGLGVERLPGLAEGLAERLLGGADLVHVVAAQRLPGPLDRSLELRLQVGRQLVAPFLRILLDFIGHAVQTVARVDFLTPLLVLGRMRLGVLHHLLDVVVGQ